MAISSSPHRSIGPIALALAIASACQGGRSGGAPTAPQAESAALAAKPGAAPVATVQNPARGPETLLFSFADNRLLAHELRGGGIVALAGSPGFAKYLRFAKPKVSWTLQQKQDGVPVALADSYANLDLPLTEAQLPAAKAAWARVHTPVARRLSLVVNGKSAGTVALVAGWQTAKIELPPGLARVGDNRLQLVSSKGPHAALAWFQLGGEAGSADPPPVYDTAKKELVLAADGGLAWYVQVPRSGRLVADVGGAGCRVQVTARAHQAPPVEGVLAGTGAAVELGALAGKVARIELTAQGCPEARLRRSGLAVPGAAPTVKRTKRPKHLVLWIMDSLRADRVRPFRADARPETPNFERLSQTGTVFRRTYVQGNESRASHASIWSSQYPINHQMIKNGAKLSASWTTLGEAMKAAGLRTSGVSANGYIVAKWGFGEGWDSYRNNIHQGGGVRGEDVLKLALGALALKTEEPSFLYLGTIDTHVSWRAKEPWISRYSPTYTGRFKKEALGTDVEKMATGKLAISDVDRQHIVAIYDSNVSYQDDLLAKLEAGLTELGRREDTMVVVTADHGDEQWEDGRVGHGASLRETLVGVPLLIHYPPLFPGGIVEEGVDTVDILPTLLDAIGVEAPPEAQGESLLPLAQGVGRGYPRPSIASQYEFAHAMRLGDWKVRVAGAAVPMLFDLAADPLEKNDLAEARPLERRFLTDVFSTFLVHQKEWKKRRWGVASNASPAFAEDLEKR